MNKATVSLTETQYRDLIGLIRNGYENHRPNPRIAAALLTEGNLGIRISDVLALTLSDIIRDGSRWRLNIIEKKTKKTRRFTVPDKVYSFLKEYCQKNDIPPERRIFDISTRQIQSTIKDASEYLHLQNISTHSFRKTFATRIYKNSGNNIRIAQVLLQHSSVSTTQRYIGFDTEEIERAISQSIDIF